MAGQTHTIRKVTDGSAIVDTTVYSAGFFTPREVDFEELSTYSLRMTYWLGAGTTRKSLSIDLTPTTGDTLILQDAEGATTATYGVGGTSVTPLQLNVILNPLFIDAGRSALTLATTKLGFEQSSTFAAIDLTRTDFRLVFVEQDEVGTLDNSKGIYLFDGATEILQIVGGERQ